MADAQATEQFILRCFQKYSINYHEHFQHYDEDTETCSVQRIVQADGTVNLYRVQKAAHILGVSPDALLALDEAGVMQRYEKYPYFRRRLEFDYAYMRSFQSEDYEALCLLGRLCGEPYVPKEATRYNYPDVIKRMTALLKEVDASIPGTYHSGAAVKNLRIRTTNFCHCSGIGEMLHSYMEMIGQFGALFFKALREELSGPEIRDYNFLVSTIGIKDRLFSPAGYLYYGILKLFREDYRRERSKDLFFYIKVDRYHQLEPWKCAEFTEDRELAQQYAGLFPKTKQEMRRFALDVSKFFCQFSWSDAKPIATQEELDLVNQYGCPSGEEPMTLETCGRELTEIYVPKTPEELKGDDVFAEKLRALAGPAGQGGIVCGKPIRESERMHMKRCFQRACAFVGKSGEDLYE